MVCVYVSNRRFKTWPLYRTGLWMIGIVCASISVYGPIAKMAHVDFTIHMVGHLLLGMLAPLLMALGAPVSLLLRTLPVQTARKLTSFLKSWPARLYTDPLVASFLNIGGLWILYTTSLYHLMHQSVVLHVLIHLHVFIAGYLFTISMIYIDPMPHQRSYIYRAIVLVFALAAHGILSKYIYASPPLGVSQIEAETGAMLMYYGGDIVDAILIFILCYQWFKATRPRGVTMNGKSVLALGDSK